MHFDISPITFDFLVGVFTVPVPSGWTMEELFMEIRKSQLTSPVLRTTTTCVLFGSALSGTLEDTRIFGPQILGSQHLDYTFHLILSVTSLGPKLVYVRRVSSVEHTEPRATLGFFYLFYVLDSLLLFGSRRNKAAWIRPADSLHPANSFNVALILVPCACVEPILCPLILRSIR